MICRSSDIFYRFGNDRILPKNVRLKQKSMKTKNCVLNQARYTKEKNHFLWFTLERVTYENIKIKLWSTNSILKPWHFSLQKENACKVQIRFVKCYTLAVTEGYHILLSPLNRLVTYHFIMSRIYIIRTSWEHNQRKRKCRER